jgi:hypothetical protein
MFQWGYEIHGENANNWLEVMQIKKGLMDGVKKKMGRREGRISSTIKKPTNERTKEAEKNKPYITHKENR